MVTIPTHLGYRIAFSWYHLFGEWTPILLVLRADHLETVMEHREQLAKVFGGGMGWGMPQRCFFLQWELPSLDGFDLRTWIRMILGHSVSRNHHIWDGAGVSFSRVRIPEIAGVYPKWKMLWLANQNNLYLSISEPSLTQHLYLSIIIYVWFWYIDR